MALSVGEITTRLEPSITSIVAIDPRTGLPRLNRRDAATSVRVQDGETIAIGGLTLQQEFATKRKIPLLGDLPIVGELFRSRAKSQVNSELVLFITPHLLTDRGRLTNEQVEESFRERFLKNEKE